MSGVTIIREIGSITKVGHPFLAFALLCVALLLSFYGWIVMEKGNIVGVAMCVVGVVLVICAWNFAPTVVKEVSYEVIIDDTVKLSEFSDNYEIVAYDEIRNVYTVKERK